METLRFVVGALCAILLSALLFVVVKIGLIVGLIALAWWLLAGA